MTDQFIYIYVVTTNCGDDERAFTLQDDAYRYKDWLESISGYGIIQIKEMYLESNNETPKENLQRLIEESGSQQLIDALNQLEDN